MNTFASLNGKSAIVTGGSRGIGRAIVTRLRQHNVSVLFTYVQAREEAEALCAETGALAINADAADPENAAMLVTHAIETFGQIDILVLNAGITRDRVIWKLLEADFDQVMATNLKSAFYLIREVAPHFRERQSGKIVTVSSINGLRGKGGQVAYATSKGGLIALTKSVARELGPKNVQVNAVAPGFSETDMTRAASQSVRDIALAETALGRLGQPQHVADAVLFLVSDLADHITGQVLQVDGGQLT
jgi:3-oxoacyl-[acyl-carrier protein] reductase